ncbi:MAG: hypothetical protein IJU10_01575, partial [Clostridia bacterium]|nr:hypothetical protein [Clostridia bacterium]
MKKIVSIVLIVLLLVGAVYLAAACSSLLKDATLTVKDGAVKVASPVVNAVYKAFVNGKEEDVEADAETGEYEIKIPEESGEKLEVSVEVYDESGKQIGTITKTFDCLDTVVVEAKDGMYDWTASDEAIKKLYPDAQVKYKVWLNDEIFEQAEATCTPDAGISTIRVRPFLVGNSDLYSRYSELKSFTMLAKPSSVRYDGTYLYWAPVDFADMVPTYKVNVAISESESYEATVTNANAMDLAAEFEDVFADEAKKARMYISVQAISSSEKYQTSAASDAELFSYLSGVQNIRFSGSKVVWEANAVADAYRVEVTSNGSIEEYVVEAETFEADEDPYFDVSTVTFAQTTVEVRVRPTVKDAKPINVFAEYSLRVTANFLEVPSELKFEHGFFYWKGVTNAKGYRLTVEKCNSRNEVISTEDVEVGQNVLSVVYPFEEEGLYKVYIATMAGDSPVYVDSIKKGPIEVTRLGSPRTGIKLAESGLNRNFSNTPGAMYTMHLSFNGVGGTGTYYQLLVNGTMIDSGSTAPSFTFEVPANASDKTSDTIDIEVKTLSFNANTLVNGNQVTLNSLTTLKLTCKKLGKPTNLRIEDNLLTWDDNNAESALAAVKAYTVFPSGELQTVYAQNYLDREDTVKNTCSFSLTGYTAGEYPMRVCSRGELTDV